MKNFRPDKEMTIVCDRCKHKFEITIPAKILESNLPQLEVSCSKCLEVAKIKLI